MSKDNTNLYTINTKKTYNEIKNYSITTKQKIYKTDNFAMSYACPNISKKIYEVCGENDRAAYGQQVLKSISEKLTVEFEKSFTERNLRKMRQLYLVFQFGPHCEPN